MSNVTAITVPDIGDFDAVEVIELLVKVGDTIKAEQSLITVESDKASMEIPASHGGVVKSIEVKVGYKLAQGSIVLHVEASSQVAASAPAAPAPAAAAAPVIAVPSAEPAVVSSSATVSAAAAEPVAALASVPAVGKLEMPASTAGLPHASP